MKGTGGLSNLGLLRSEDNWTLFKNDQQIDKDGKSFAFTFGEQSTIFIFSLQILTNCIPQMQFVNIHLYLC